MFGAKLRHRVTVYNRSDGSPDVFGDPADTFDSGTEYPAWVSPQGSIEDTIDRDIRITGYLVVLPRNAVIRADSELEYGGVRMRVDGKPKELPDRHGTHHYEVSAQLVEGAG